MANADSIVAWAEAQVGKPYVWGGTGPGSFDCSGLTMEAYKNGGGITIPRVAAAQQAAGTPVDAASLQVADLVFAGNPAYHVAMYTGGGSVVAADNTSVPVRVRSFNPSEWTGGFRRMNPNLGGGSVSNPVSDLLSAASPLFGMLEGVNALAGNLTSPKFWDRIGKAGIAIAIIVIGIAFMNRKRIEQTAATAGKAAATAAVA